MYCPAFLRFQSTKMPHLGMIPGALLQLDILRGSRYLDLGNPIRSDGAWVAIGRSHVLHYRVAVRWFLMEWNLSGLSKRHLDGCLDHPRCFRRRCPLRSTAGHSGIVRSALCLPGGRVLTAGEAGEDLPNSQECCNGKRKPVVQFPLHKTCLFQRVGRYRGCVSVSWPA